MALFRQVTILGLGLIGGSLGMAIRRRRLARKVVGWSRKSSTLRLARKRGAIDQGFTNLAQAVAGADLVVLATPVDRIVPLARQAARAMARGSILTDVGSTKARVVRELARILPRTIHFVGGHPLAGSEQRGIQAARPALFDGSVCVLTRTPHTSSRALAQVRRLWAPLVYEVIVLDPIKHDTLLAEASHLPHALAFSLAASVSREASALAPRSLADMTRIAGSDPGLWDDIFLSNDRSLLRAMDRFDSEWKKLRHALVKRNGSALHRLLRDSQRRRAMM